MNTLKTMKSLKTACFLILIWVLLATSLSACIQIVAPTPEPSVTSAVIYVTQIVTEIIPPTPLPATPTSPPTATPEPPTATPTWDPMNAPIYYPLEDCVASRLHVGDNAMVSLSGGANGIRYGTDLFYDTIITYAQPGSTLEIVNGPFCSRGWIVWFVRTLDGTVGYTPEGNGNEYWLLPLQP